ncbi:iron chaperone [Nocardia sp. NPDC003345]
MSTTTRKAGTRTAAKNSSAVAFSDDERAAMKEHAQELKTAARRRNSRTAAADGAADVLAKIAEMADADRALAERIHALIQASAPSLSPKLWYGMPAYARDGKIVCFFQSAAKFKARYATLGFNDAARLDDGAVWPTAFALTTLSAADEEFIGELVKRAAG